jgi:hypothetical protein
MVFETEVRITSCVLDLCSCWRLWDLIW